MYIEVKKWHQSNEANPAGAKIHPDTIRLERLQGKQKNEKIEIFHKKQLWRDGNIPNCRNRKSDSKVDG